MSDVLHQDRAHGWLAVRSRWLPPVFPMVVMIWADAVVLHLLAPIIGVPISSLYLALMDVSLVVGGTAVGWQVRRAVLGSSKEAFWEAWEQPVGTRTIAVVSSVVGIVLLGWSIAGRWSWIGFAIAIFLTSVVAFAWAADGTSTEAITVIPEGEQPEPLEDYQRVELPWSLGPQVPDVQGAVGLWIKKSTVDLFRSMNPTVKWSGSLPQFDWYVDQGVCEELNTLADRLMALSRQHGLTKYLEVCLVLDLVQQIRYMTDLDSKGIPDYWRFPLETISDGCGDCEDFAILAVALLSAMGHRTCFFDLPGHVATGVAALPEETGASFEATDGVRFYFVETTADGWHIGELPPDITRDSVRIAAVVAPLRGRQPDRRLETVPAGQWRMDSAVLTRSWLLIGAAGSALSAGLHWLMV